MFAHSLYLCFLQWGKFVAIGSSHTAQGSLISKPELNLQKIQVTSQ